MSRIPRIAHEAHCGVHPQWLHRPLVPIVAFSPETATRRRMALLWGVTSRNISDIKKIEGLAVLAEKRLLEERLVKKGDVIGIVAGTPMGIRGTTNFMKFHVIGSVS